MNASKVLAVDIGGTKIGIAAVTGGGRIAASSRMATDPAVPPAEVLAAIAERGRALIEEAGWPQDELLAVGVAAPGPIDADRGVLVRPPNLPSWDGVPLVRSFEEAFDCPVRMDNDANGGALAEWMFGAGAGLRHFIYLTMSTGIGGGIILDGRLYRGATGDAGEVGHHVLDIHGPACGCGQRGCFEAYCSGTHVARWLRETLQDRPREPMMRAARGAAAHLRFETLRDAAQAGDPLALEMWNDYALRLAQGLGNLVNMFNPEMIALGTIAVHAGDFLLEPVRRHIDRFAWPRARAACRIVPSVLGPRIGDLGAAAIALYEA